MVHPLVRRVHVKFFFLCLTRAIRACGASGPVVFGCGSMTAMAKAVCCEHTRHLLLLGQFIFYCSHDGWMNGQTNPPRDEIERRQIAWTNSINQILIINGFVYICSIWASAVDWNDFMYVIVIVCVFSFAVFYFLVWRTYIAAEQRIASTNWCTYGIVCIWWKTPAHTIVITTVRIYSIKR